MGLPMCNIFNYRWLCFVEDSVAKDLQAYKIVRFLESGFQMLEIAEVSILDVIHRVLCGFSQQIEFGNTIVECPYILLQIVEHLLLDELIETTLAKIVPLKALDLDKIIEVSGELYLVMFVLTVCTHAFRTLDIQFIEAGCKLVLVQHVTE